MTKKQVAARSLQHAEYYIGMQASGLAVESLCISLLETLHEWCERQHVDWRLESVTRTFLLAHGVTDKAGIDFLIRAMIGENWHDSDMADKDALIRQVIQVIRSFWAQEPPGHELQAGKAIASLTQEIKMGLEGAYHLLDVAESVMDIGRIMGHDHEDEIHELFHDAQAYIIDYFELEAAKMQACNYPEQEAHIAQHHLFRRQLEAIMDAAKTGHDLSNHIHDTNEFVYDWLKSHVDQFDRAFESWRKNHTVEICNEDGETVIR